MAATPRGPRFSLPGCDRLLGEPHRQAAALAQRRVIGGRVRGPVPLLWDVTAAIGVGLERQGRIPGQWWEVGRSTLPGPAGPSDPCNTLPALQSGVLNPQSEAAAPTQARFIGRPVLHLERHLRDVVTAGRVVLVWHRRARTREGRAFYYPRPAECTNAGCSLSARRHQPGSAKIRLSNLPVWARLATASSSRVGRGVPSRTSHTPGS